MPRVVIEFDALDRTGPVINRIKAEIAALNATAAGSPIAGGAGGGARAGSAGGIVVGPEVSRASAAGLSSINREYLEWLNIYPRITRANRTLLGDQNKLLRLEEDLQTELGRGNDANQERVRQLREQIAAQAAVVDARQREIPQIIETASRKREESIARADNKRITDLENASVRERIQTEKQATAAAKERRREQDAAFARTDRENRARQQATAQDNAAISAAATASRERQQQIEGVIAAERRKRQELEANAELDRQQDQRNRARRTQRLGALGTISAGSFNEFVRYDSTLSRVRQNNQAFANSQADLASQTQRAAAAQALQNESTRTGQRLLAHAVRTYAAYALVGGAVLGGIALVNTGLRENIDLVENQNLALEVFAGRYGEVDDVLDRSAVSFGQSRAEATKSVAVFGAFFKTLGIERESVRLFGKDVADLSLFFQSLATNIGSFRNIGFSEAVDKLQSALAGEVRAVRELGLNVYENQVLQEIDRLGIGNILEENEQVAKTLARISLITQQTALDQGDYTRTLHETANASRTALAHFKNLVGEGFFPLERAVNYTVNAWNNLFERDTEQAAQRIERSMYEITQEMSQQVGLARSDPFVNHAAFLRLLRDAEPSIGNFRALVTLYERLQSAGAEGVDQRLPELLLLGARSIREAQGTEPDSRLTRIAGAGIIGTATALGGVVGGPVGAALGLGASATLVNRSITDPREAEQATEELAESIQFLADNNIIPDIFAQWESGALSSQQAFQAITFVLGDLGQSGNQLASNSRALYQFWLAQIAGAQDSESALHELRQELDLTEEQYLRLAAIVRGIPTSATPDARVRTGSSPAFRASDETHQYVLETHQAFRETYEDIEADTLALQRVLNELEREYTITINLDGSISSNGQQVLNYAQLLSRLGTSRPVQAAEGGLAGVGAGFGDPVGVLGLGATAINLAGQGGTLERGESYFGDFRITSEESGGNRQTLEEAQLSAVQGAAIRAIEAGIEQGSALYTRILSAASQEAAYRFDGDLSDLIEALGNGFKTSSDLINEETERIRAEQQANLARLRGRIDLLTFDQTADEAGVRPGDPLYQRFVTGLNQRNQFFAQGEAEGLSRELLDAQYELGVLTGKFIDLSQVTDDVIATERERIEREQRRVRGRLDVSRFAGRLEDAGIGTDDPIFDQFLRGIVQRDQHFAGGGTQDEYDLGVELGRFIDLSSLGQQVTDEERIEAARNEARVTAFQRELDPETAARLVAAAAAEAKARIDGVYTEYILNNGETVAGILEGEADRQRITDAENDARVTAFQQRLDPETTARLVAASAAEAKARIDGAYAEYILEGGDTAARVLEDNRFAIEGLNIRLSASRSGLSEDDPFLRQYLRDRDVVQGFREAGVSEGDIARAQLAGTIPDPEASREDLAERTRFVELSPSIDDSFQELVTNTNKLDEFQRGLMATTLASLDTTIKNAYADGLLSTEEQRQINEKMGQANQHLQNIELHSAVAAQNARIGFDRLAFENQENFATAFSAADRPRLTDAERAFLGEFDRDPDSAIFSGDIGSRAGLRELLDVEARARRLDSGGFLDFVEASGTGYSPGERYLRAIQDELRELNRNIQRPSVTVEAGAILTNTDVVKTINDLMVKFFLSQPLPRRRR